MHTNMKKRRWTTAALLSLALGLGGCTAQASDRAGGDAAGQVRVLTLANANDGAPIEVSSWAAQVGQLSKGTLRIEIRNDWRSGEPGAEAGIIDDVSNSKVDMAWVGARAFDRAGVKSFQALLAPMLIDSQALQAKVFTAGIAARMVADIDSDRLVGIGVLPGPIRKVLGVSKPFLRPADFVGKVIGLQDGEVAKKSLVALGAKTRNVPSGAKLDGLDGYEQQLASIGGNHYELSARFVTSNVNLWPRPLVLFAGKNVVDSLTAEQQGALRTAVGTSLPANLEAARSEDQDAVPDLCKAGMTFPVASAQDLRDLQDSVLPLYDELSADPGTKGNIAAIKALKAAVGSGPDTTTCFGQPVGTTGSSSSAIPDGTYQMTLTGHDWRDCPGHEREQAGLLEMELRNSEVKVYGRPLGVTGAPAGPREIGWVGSYRVFRDRFELTESGTRHILSALWKFDGKKLTLSDMKNGGCDDVTVWTTHPWLLK